MPSLRLKAGSARKRSLCSSERVIVFHEMWLAMAVAIPRLSIKCRDCWDPLLWDPPYPISDRTGRPLAGHFTVLFSWSSASYFVERVSLGRVGGWVGSWVCDWLAGGLAGWCNAFPVCSNLLERVRFVKMTKFDPNERSTKGMSIGSEAFQKPGFGN